MILHMCKNSTTCLPVTRRRKKKYRTRTRVHEESLGLVQGRAWRVTKSKKESYIISLRLPTSRRPLDLSFFRHLHFVITMANVMHHHIEFAPLPVAHAPSPFGFGFGLGQSSSGWQTTPTTSRANPLSLHQLASSLNQGTLTASPLHKSNKRRLEVDDEDSPVSVKASVNSDESMDRSPTPERPKRAAPKRARTTPGAKEQAGTKENKSLPSEEDEMDVGVLLGMF